MKVLRIIPITILSLALANLAVAQAKEESFKVSGNCGMCKSKIEKAAKTAGATYALWNSDTKLLTVKYNTESTNAAKIQQKIAEVGYDNVGFKATDAAYDKLHGCCKYEREAVAAKESCCAKGSCDMQECKDAGCCKDGKCDMSLCKMKDGQHMQDCCVNGSCEMPECKEAGCCKDGKCDMSLCPGKKAHNGKSCCKKDSETKKGHH